MSNTPRCTACGETHDELEPAFRRPDAYFAVPKEERGDRVVESDDLVAIDGRAFFIRCIAPFPVKGRAEPYSWGLWVRVTRRAFEDYSGRFDEDPPPRHAGYVATIANQSPVAPPLLGVRARVRLTSATQRPMLRFLDATHPLARKQAGGVTRATLEAWTRWAVHEGQAVPCGRQRFATLAREGWSVVAPGDVGRSAIDARGVRPGSFVKAPFRFLAADVRGNPGPRIELMWVAVDHVTRNALSGTLANHPAVPGTLALGTRVWLRPSDCLAHERGASPTLH